MRRRRSPCGVLAPETTRRCVMRDPETRAAAGRDARKVTPPESHAEFAPPADRPDPVSILQAQDAGRVPELVPIRHGRMGLSPFSFLRGSAAVMAADLAA